MINLSFYYDKNYDICFHHKDGTDIKITIQEKSFKLLVDNSISKNFLLAGTSIQNIIEFVEKSLQKTTLIDFFIPNAYALINVPIMIGVAVGLTVSNYMIYRSRKRDLEEELGGNFCCEMAKNIRDEAQTLPQKNK